MSMDLYEIILNVSILPKESRNDCGGYGQTVWDKRPKPISFYTLYKL